MPYEKVSPMALLLSTVSPQEPWATGGIMTPVQSSELTRTTILRGQSTNDGPDELGVHGPEVVVAAAVVEDLS